MFQPYDHDSNRPVYFLHIPKTAGTTFRVFLENQFPISQICRTYDFYGMKQYGEAELASFRLFRGHMGYNLVNLLPARPYTLVMLRNPIERAVSHFEHIRRDPNHPKHHRIVSRGTTLKEYLEDPELSRDLVNGQTKPLSHHYDREVLRHLLKESGSPGEFGRLWERGRRTMGPAEMLSLALERLEGMDFVGIAEELEQSLQLASWLLEAPSPDTSQALNINPQRTSLEELDEETLELLHARLELDQRLYERGRELFREGIERLKAADPEEGYRNRWRRRSPVSELEFTFDHPLPGSGWHQRELLPGRGLFRWTGPGVRSSFDVKLKPGSDYRLQIEVVAQAEEGLLDRLRLRFNGEAIDFDVQPSEAEGWRLAALVPARLLESQECCSTLLFELPRTVVVGKGEGLVRHSGRRAVGIAVLGIHFFSLRGRR